MGWGWGEAVPWQMRPVSVRDFKICTVAACSMNSQSSNFFLLGLCTEVHREELFLLLPIQIFSRFGSRSVLHHISSVHLLEYRSLFIQKIGHHMGCKSYYYL